jgi:hypothetical protein
MLLRWTKFVTLLLLLAGTLGFLYEKIGEWQDNKRLPQIGHSVDVGTQGLTHDGLVSVTQMVEVHCVWEGI